MKKVLIISPYFPPTNAADMQRVRMSLPYFEDFGWEAEVVTISLSNSDMVTDSLLLESIPTHVPIHYVDAWKKKWTSKIGLGSIALRSLFFYRKKVNQLLREKKFDLIYFSTTQFPVCILGAYWKKKYGVPYVIDMQDPWHTEFYQDKPKAERPPKYWFAYRISKYLEPIAMKEVDGLVSVSQGYLETLATRYPNCKSVVRDVITFGAFPLDFQIAKRNIVTQPPAIPAGSEKINIVYVGRGGKDMEKAVSLLFSALKKGLEKDFAHFQRLHFYFIGTSYASAGSGIETIKPVANSMGVSDYVTEVTDRVPFYQTLNTLAAADGLFVPGSTDPNYTASKIYPYVLAQRPLLAIFHPNSSVVPFLQSCNIGTVITFDDKEEKSIEKVQSFLMSIVQNLKNKLKPNLHILDNYSARSMTERQCLLFNEVLELNEGSTRRQSPVIMASA